MLENRLEALEAGLRELQSIPQIAEMLAEARKPKPVEEPPAEKPQAEPVETEKT